MLSSGITNSPWSFTNTSANWLLRRAYTWFDSVFLFTSLISNTYKGINFIHVTISEAQGTKSTSCVCHTHVRMERSGLSNVTLCLRRWMYQSMRYMNPSWVWGRERKIRLEDHRLASRGLPIYMLRQKSIPSYYWKERFVAFKVAPNIKNHSLYYSSNRRLYKSHTCILNNYINTRFGTCADIVTYLCKLETKWHQILDASLSNIHKVACGKCSYNLVSISSK